MIRQPRAALRAVGADLACWKGKKMSMGVRWIALGGLSLLLGSFGYARPVTIENDLPTFDLTLLEGGYVMRLDEETNDLLLSSLNSEQFAVAISGYDPVTNALGPSEHLAVFRFDPTTEQTTLEDDDVWDSQTSPITQFTVSSSARVSEWELDEGAEIPFLGQKSSNLVSPAGKLLLSVLTIDGPCDPPFISAGLCHGQTYHYLVGTDGNIVGPVDKVGFSDASLAGGYTWSIDGHYIIIADPAAPPRFFVVHVAEWVFPDNGN